MIRSFSDTPFDHTLVQCSLDEQFKSNLDKTLKWPSWGLGSLLVEARHSERMRDEVADRYKDASESQRSEIDQWMETLEPEQRHRVMQRRATALKISVLSLHSMVPTYLDDGSFMSLAHTSREIEANFMTRSRLPGMRIAMAATRIGTLPIDERTKVWTGLLDDTLNVGSDLSKCTPLVKLAQALCELPEKDRAPQFELLHEAVQGLSASYRCEPLMALLKAIEGEAHPVLIQEHHRVDGKEQVRLRCKSRFYCHGPVSWKNVVHLFDALWDSCMGLSTAGARARALLILLTERAVGDKRIFVEGKLREAVESENTQQQAKLLLALRDHIRDGHWSPRDAAIEDLLYLLRKLVQDDRALAKDLMPTILEAIWFMEGSQAFGRALEIALLLPPRDAVPSLVTLASSALTRGTEHSLVSSLDRYARLLAVCRGLPFEDQFEMRLKLTDRLGWNDISDSEHWRPYFEEAYGAAWRYAGEQRELLLAHLGTAHSTSGIDVRDRALADLAPVLNGGGGDGRTLLVFARRPVKHMWLLNALLENPRLDQADILEEMLLHWTSVSDERGVPGFLDKCIPLLDALAPTERATPLHRASVLIGGHWRMSLKGHEEAIANLYLACTGDAALMCELCRMVGRGLLNVSRELRMKIAWTARNALPGMSIKWQARTLPPLLQIAQALENEAGEELCRLLMQDWDKLKRRIPQPS